MASSEVPGGGARDAAPAVTSAGPGRAAVYIKGKDDHINEQIGTP